MAKIIRINEPLPKKVGCVGVEGRRKKGLEKYLAFPVYAEYPLETASHNICKIYDHLHMVMYLKGLNCRGLPRSRSSHRNYLASG